MRDAILGQRVAKTFNTRFRGDPMTYRGTVSAVTRGPEDKGLEEDEYTIVYDDSDREDVGLTELYGKCMLWEEDEGSLCSSALADTKHTILAQPQMSLYLLRLAHVLPFQGRDLDRARKQPKKATGEKDGPSEGGSGNPC